MGKQENKRIEDEIAVEMEVVKRFTWTASAGRCYPLAGWDLCVLYLYPPPFRLGESA
jgi:hypothetical protein